MDEISKKIKNLSLEQNAIKILINSIYGAFGNKWFYFYNTDIAQSITLQGRDLIQFAIKSANYYFNNKWHLDKELHEILGISDKTISKIDNEVCIYTDTDSIYIQLDSVINSIQGANFDNDQALNLCIMIDKYRLSEYFNKCFEKYGEFYKTKNRLKLKLENLSEVGLWLSGKNYIIKVAYEPNPNFILLPKEKRYLIIKGIEAIQSAYPIWARHKIKSLTEIILEKGKSLDLEKDLIPHLIKYKEEFISLPIEEVSFNFYVRKYNKYVNDEKNLILNKGISIYSRSAAYYNHLLIKNELHKKYQKIREGDKIKFYYCSENEYGFDVFSYSPENYPSEIAPPIDIDLHFFNLIVEPINRQLKVMNISPISPKLKRKVEIVIKKTKKKIEENEYFPLYVVNSLTGEKEEVPEKFNNIILDENSNVKEEDFGEYLNIITKYGLNTVIIPNFQLNQYLKKITKK